MLVVGYSSAGRRCAVRLNPGAVEHVDRVGGQFGFARGQDAPSSVVGFDAVAGSMGGDRLPHNVFACDVDADVDLVAAMPAAKCAKCGSTDSSVGGSLRGVVVVDRRG